MTKTRYIYLQNGYTLADAGEFVFNIGSNDVITQLDVVVKATNGATNNKAAHIADVVTSIELMDGSEPIVSLSGYELGGMACYKKGSFVNGLISEIAADVQSIRFPISFGRWYGDEQLALDLSRHKNVQCRVKWNLAAIRAVGATGFVTATGLLTVIAHVMEGGGSPMGYLSMKRHALFTTAASGIARVDLPMDKVIKAIGIRSWETVTGGLSGISHVKLTNNENAEVPLDLDTADFLDSVVNNGLRFHYNHRFSLQGTNRVYALLKYRELMTFNNETIAIAAGGVNTGVGEEVMVQFTTSTGANLAADNTYDAAVQGHLPFGLAYLQFGAYDDPNSYFNAPNYKASRLELTQDNAGAACSVVVEQVNSY